MTDPTQSPVIMPGCTDYSRFSLDQLWDMVSPADTVSQGQIESWLQMAALCDDQADSLAAALTRLNEHWPATPNSASAKFSGEITRVVSTMRSNASESRDISLTLSDIVAALDSAKSQMQPLMDQQAHFRQMSSVSPDLTTVLVDFFTNHSEGPPAGWQDELHSQATGILASADARVESVAGRMPPVSEFRLSIDTQPGSQGGQQEQRRGPGSQLGGSVSTLTGIPNLNSPGIAPSLPSTDQPGPSSVNVVSPDQPTLAGLPTGVQLTGPTTASPDTIGTTPSVRLPSPASSVFVGGVIPQPPLAPIGSVPSTNPIANDPSNTGAALPETNEAPRTAAGTPMMSPGMAGRPQGAGSRSGVRPAGRAALWQSQRQSKRDRHDPWSVRQGVPQIIEAPPEPEDHDPGPGVIGLDT
jgi:hypothetical protein